ncbi:MAG: hypothetical protein WD894_26895 [Pirellulales bacterium]
MPRTTYCLAGMILALSTFSANGRAGEKATAPDDSVYGEFVGSSPCSGAIRPFLQIPAESKADLMHWRLTLHQNPKTKAPTGYKLRCDYGPAVPGLPGLGKTRQIIERQGRWKITKGIKSNPDAVVYELANSVALFKLDDNILHVLNRDRSLMNGTGGWSYTLNRTEAAEKRVDPQLASTVPDMSYTISPVATGPAVFGVFEGRTPYHGIARELKVTAHPAGTKAKWRVTLYHDPKTLEPTTYKVEGYFFRQSAREGTWTIERSAEGDPQQTVFRLAPTNAGADLLLLKGDDNVLFFLDKEQKPLVGHAEFSYTLNRREVTGQPAAPVSGE